MKPISIVGSSSYVEYWLDTNHSLLILSPINYVSKKERSKNFSSVCVCICVRLLSYELTQYKLFPEINSTCESVVAAEKAPSTDKRFISCPASKCSSYHSFLYPPDDELLDIHGVSISGLSVCEVVDIIRNAPNEFLATVRPVTSVRKALQHDFREIKYADIVHYKNGASNGNHRVTPSTRDDDYATVDGPDNGRGVCLEFKMTGKVGDIERERWR